MASQGTDGRWWQNLVLPILEPESNLYRAEPLYSHLHQELARGHRSGAPFSILLLEGQPTFGRRLKSASVRATARTLIATARLEDTPARLGSRLFALLLPGVEEPEATRIGRALELDLRPTSGGTGERWRVSCLSYPAQRERLERLAAQPQARRYSREDHGRRRPAA